MKILSVKGKNIASLTEEFEINFEDPRFQKSGVFAITGPTGSGKSTILDTISVALFGKAERYEGGGKSTTTDGSSSNVKNLLSLGTKDCYAEVTYQAKNGNICVSRWEYAKPRGKTPTSPVATFINKSANNETITGLTKVKFENERMLGLNWDQFRSIIILPQGKFNNFLLASPTDRTAILQEITGTKIYKEIADLLKEKNKKYLSDVSFKQENIASIKCLEKEELNILQEQYVDLGNKIKTSEELISNMAKAKDQEEKIRKTRLEHSVKSSNYKVAVHNDEAQNNNRKMIAEWEKFQKNKSVFIMLESTKDEYQKELRKQQINEGNLKIADKNLLDEKDKYIQSKLALENFNEQSASRNDEIQKATVLDTEIMSIRNNSEEQEKENRSKNKVYLKAKKEKDDALQIFNSVNVELQKTEALIDALEEYAKFADDWSVVLRTIDERVKNTLELQNVEAIIERKKETYNSLKKQVEDLQRSIDDLNNENKIVAQNIASKNENHLKLKIEDIDKSSDKYRKRSECIKEFLIYSEEIPTILESIRNYESEIGKGQHQVSTINDEITNLQQKLETLIKREEIQQKEFDNAKDVTRLADYRKKLAEGTPCPLCGSVHHDMVNIEEVVNYDLNVLQDELYSLRDSQQKLNQEISEKKVTIAKIEGRVQQLTEGIRSAKTSLEEKIYKANSILENHFEMDPIPEVAINTWLSTIKDLNAESKRIEKKIEELKNDKIIIQSELSQIDKYVAKKSEIDNKILENNTALTKKNIELYDYKIDSDLENADKLKKEIEDKDVFIDSKLVGKFTAAYIFNQENCQDVSKWVDEHISKKIEELHSLCHTKDALAKKKETSEMEYDHKCRILESAEKDFNETKKKLQTTMDLLEIKKKERNKYLGGKTCDDYKQAVKKEEDTLKSSFSYAEKVYNEAEEKQKSLKNESENINAKITEFADKLKEQSQQYKDMLHNLQTTDDYFKSIIAISDDNIDELKAKIEETQKQRSAAEVEIKTLDKLLLSLKGDYNIAISLLPKEAIFDDKVNQNYFNEQTEVLKAYRADCHKIESQINIDKDQRARRANLENELAEYQKENTYWNKLFELIGDRDEFNRFAQSITFDRLLKMANIYITKFKPRYELKRHTGDTNGNLLNVVAIDHENGDMERFSHQLSGGETFIVSLSLAIALSDITANYGGGNTIQSLFIDEGLGSLDAESLNTVIEGLEKINSHGRNIGIISHVDSLKDRVQLQIRVEPIEGNIAHSRVVVV